MRKLQFSIKIATPAVRGGELDAGFFVAIEEEYAKGNSAKAEMFAPQKF
jgi:hypothetical protein